MRLLDCFLAKPGAAYALQLRSAAEPARYSVRIINNPRSSTGDDTPRTYSSHQPGAIGCFRELGSPLKDRKPLGRSIRQAKPEKSKTCVSAIPT